MIILPKKAQDTTAVNTVVEAPKIETVEPTIIQDNQENQGKDVQVITDNSVVYSEKAASPSYRKPAESIASASNSNNEMMMPGESTMKNTNETWVNTKWRPAMGWMYMAVCICDFILFPILWAVVQFWETEAINDAFRQWSPLTLQGAGLFHMAMGAVLGITAWGRSKEKIENK